MYDQIAASVASQYGLFLFALRGRYLSAVAPGMAVTPLAVLELQRAAESAGQTFLGAAETALQAHLAIYQDGSDLSALTVQKRETLGLLRGLVSQNVRDAARQLRHGQQNLAALLKGATGGMGQLVQQKTQDHAWKVRDTSGRQWDAPALVKTVVRGFAVQVDLEAAAAKADLLQVQHPDPLHKFAGMVFSVSGAKGYPSLAEIRTPVFHPNTKAKAVPYVQA